MRLTRPQYLLWSLRHSTPTPLQTAKFYGLRAAAMGGVFAGTILGGEIAWTLMGHGKIGTMSGLFEIPDEFPHLQLAPLTSGVQFSVPTYTQGAGKGQLTPAL